MKIFFLIVLFPLFSLFSYSQKGTMIYINSHYSNLSDIKRIVCICKDEIFIDSYHIGGQLYQPVKVVEVIDNPNFQISNNGNCWLVELPPHTPEIKIKVKCFCKLKNLKLNSDIDFAPAMVNEANKAKTQQDEWLVQEQQVDNEWRIANIIDSSCSDNCVQAVKIAFTDFLNKKYKDCFTRSLSLSDLQFDFSLNENFKNNLIKCYFLDEVRKIKRTYTIKDTYFKRKCLPNKQNKYVIDFSGLLNYKIEFYGK